jgi:exonuclease VII small subunit
VADAMPPVRQKIEELERSIEMLYYSIENLEAQLSMFREGELEWMYAHKILESCRVAVEEKIVELEKLKNPGAAGA